MNPLKEVMDLITSSTKTETPEGRLIEIDEESTIKTAVDYTTDEGQYITFQQYTEDVLSEIIDIDYVNQRMVFCAMIKLGIIQKRSEGSYIPPTEVYEQLKGKDGLDTVGFYRKKSNSKGGLTFGFDIDNIHKLNIQYKASLVDMIQSLEDELDSAFARAEEFTEILKNFKRSSGQTGKISVHLEKKAYFEQEKRRLVRKHLDC